MTGLSRAELVAKLNTWNDDRLVDLKTGGMVCYRRTQILLPVISCPCMMKDSLSVLLVALQVNVFRVANPAKWPPTVDESRRIIDKMYEQLELREEQDLDRFDQVMNLITGKACFARGLAAYFGDSLPGDAQECGCCKSCEAQCFARNTC